MLEWSTPKPDAQPQTIAQARLERRKRRRLFRVCRWSLGFTLAIAIVLVAGRHALFRAVLTNRVKSALGVELVGARFFASLNGKLTVQDIVLRAPGVEGDAGIVLTAEQFSAQIDFVGLLSGGGTRAITNVQAYRPVIRISQHVTDGSLNIDPIIRASTGGSGGQAAVYLPEVEVIEATLEFGEHLGDWFEPLASIRAQGVLEAPNRAEPKYELRLSELTDEQRPRMQIAGEIDMQASNASLRLVNLDLSAWAPSASTNTVRGMWSRMALQGMARSAEFQYDPDSGMQSEFQLEGVDLTIPVPVATADDPDAMHPLQLRNVDGFFRFSEQGIQADLRGVVEDVAGRVELLTHGLGFNDAFESTITIEPFFFAQGSSLVPFAPPEALEIIELFETPQALIQGTIRITRAEPNAAIGVEGEFTFDDGGMAYVEFPYPVHDVRGTVAFDDEGIDLIGLQGFGSGGSVLQADGRIIGYDDDAGVDIVIHGQGVPTDQILEDSLPESWRPMFGVLFDEAHTQALRTKNMVLSAKEHEDISQQIQTLSRELNVDNEASTREQLAVLGERLRAPIFDPGGIGEAKIHIYRPRGGVYKYDVDVLFPTLWIMPEPLPYPLAAEQVVVEVRDTIVQVRAPIVRGLRGGLGQGLITIDLANGSDDADILVETTLRDVPVDAFLLGALPKVRIFQDRPEGSTTLPELLGAMQLQGRIDVDLQYDTAAPIDPLTLRLDIQGVSSHLVDTPPLAIDSMRGIAHVTMHNFNIGPLEGLVFGAPGSITINGELGIEDQGVVVDARIEQLPVASHASSFIRLLSAKGADAVATLQQTFRPSGKVDVDIAVNTFGQGTGAVTVRAMNAQHIGFDWLEGRFTMPSSTGAIVFDSSTNKIKLRSWIGPFSYNDEPSGTVEATGVMLAGAKAPLDIQLRLGDLRFESSLVEVALRRGAPKLSAWREAYGLEGSFDAYLRPRRTEQGMSIERGWIEPKSFLLAKAENPVLIDAVRGRIEFTPRFGTADNITIQHAQWDATIDGTWSTKPTMQADLGISINSFGFDDSLRSLLPDQIQESLNAFEFDITGPWQLEQGNLLLEATEQGSTGEFAGSLVMTDASFKAGLSVTQAIGTVDMSAHWSLDESRHKEMRIEADIFAEGVLITGIPMHSVSAHLTSDGRHTQVMDIAGSLNAGNVAGTVDIQRDDNDAPRFAADFRAAGIDLGLFLDAVARKKNPQIVIDEHASGRGLVSGQIMASGRAGKDVIGRGLLIAEQGTLLDMPFLLGVVELSNLQVPSGEEITFGEVEFAIENGLVTVDHIEARSNTVQILGTGTVSLTQGTVDLIFTTRGLRRVPVLSGIVEALRNQIIAARVTGTISQPVFRAQALPSASRIFRQLLGGDDVRYSGKWVGVSPQDAPVVTMEQ